MLSVILAGAERNLKEGEDDRLSPSSTSVELHLAVEAARVWLCEVVVDVEGFATTTLNTEQFLFQMLLISA